MTAVMPYEASDPVGDTSQPTGFMHEFPRIRASLPRHGATHATKCCSLGRDRDSRLDIASASNEFQLDPS
jgi:hypothetical protein